MMNEISFETIFDGWAPVIRSLILGASVYVYLIVLLRISGKRSLSKMNAYDLVITIALGSMLSSIILTRDVSLVQGIFALTLLIAFQFLNSFLAVRLAWFNGLIKAQPTLLFFHGKFLKDNMRYERVTSEDVLAGIRQQGLTEMAQVSAVVLETDGSLSVMRGDVADDFFGSNRTD